MFITRASRREAADIKEFYREQGWGEVDPSQGTAFIARQGPILGCVRLIEVAPEKVIVEDVVVAKEHRRTGLGRRLMQAALNSRGGTLYLSCHAEHLPFYGSFGFLQMPFEELPRPIQEYFKATGDYPSDPDHVHFFLRAR
jgi:predicted GNAT family N-acyltransferase